MKRTTGPLFLVSVTLLVVVVILGWVYRSASKGSSTQQVAAAEAVVLQLQAPSGATVDQYQTACGKSSLYCVTGARSPDTLMRAVIVQLRTAGATVTTQACAAQGAETAHTPRCSALLRYQGADLSLTASDTSTQGYATASWLTASVVQANAVVPQSSALDAWNSLQIAPAAWRTDAPCVVKGSTGCNAYDQTLTVPGSLKAASAAFQSSLTAGRYRTDQVTCTPAQGTVKAQCVIEGSRFRSIGGRDHMVASGTVTELDASRSTARLIAAPN